MKPYRPYALVFDFHPENCRLFIGRERRTHDELLRTNGLEDRFEKKPRDFVMGRLLASENLSLAIVDTVSDLFIGKTRIERPLTHMAANRLRVIESALRKALPGMKILLLDGGPSLRASGISDDKLPRIAKGQLPPGSRWLDSPA